MWTEIVRPQRKKNQGSVNNAVAQQVPPAGNVSADTAAPRFSSKSAADMMGKMAPRGSEMSISVLPIKRPQKQQTPLPPAVVMRTTNPLPAKPAKDVKKASKDAGKNYDLMMFVKPAGSNLKMISNQKEIALMNSKTAIKKAIIVNEEFVKHRFITTKKKKKVFSKIKKRILMVS
jgi:hypothetical protein